ncbi:MAG: hypothetical protein JKY96_09230 [Phycisphaerales bacterium]|nr:hypothetical protein [Phycisphaerales bacterium]
MKTVSTIIVLACSTALGGTPQRAYIIEGSAFFGAPGIELATIGVVDLADPSQVSVISQGAVDLRFGGADIRPGTGEFVGFENTTNSMRVFDLVNNGNTLIDSTGYMDSGVAGMAYSNDGSIAYITTTVGAFVRVLQVDAATAMPMSVHNILTDAVSSLAVVPKGHPTLTPGDLYGLALTGFGGLRLVQFDLDTNTVASTQPVFGIGFQAQFETGLDFAPDGTLYAAIQGFDEVSPDVFVEISSHLFTINTASGTATDLGVIEGDQTWDSVTLVIDDAPVGCAADITGEGNLNLQDVFAFLALFNAADPAADLAAPFGTFNLQDVFAYLALFNAGCP